MLKKWIVCSREGYEVGEVYASNAKDAMDIAHLTFNLGFVGFVKQA
jgi:hypothetical protein